MIDYIKFSIPSSKYLHVFAKEAKFHFSQIYDNNTEELKYPMWGECDGMKIKVTQNIIEIDGSIHKYWNRSEYGVDANYNDFSRDEIKKALDKLALDIGFSLEDTTLRNLEYGVNIEVTADPTAIIQKNILTYKDREPKINDDYKNTGKFTQFEFSNYRFKIYDKGKHCDLDSRLLRIELKTLKSSHVTKGIKWNLTKLYDKSTLEDLGTKLKEMCTELLMCDRFELVDIADNSDHHKLLEFTNPRNWVYWRSTLNNKAKNRRKKVFSVLKDRYDLDTTQQEIIDIVSRKIREFVS